MRRWTALLAATALLLVGVLLGVLATHLFYLQRARQPGGLARLGTRLMLIKLDHDLDLKPAQRQEVERILADVQGEFAEVRREMAPRLLATLDRSHDRIAAVLDPEQREKFERLRAGHRALMQKLLEGR